MLTSLVVVNILQYICIKSLHLQLRQCYMSIITKSEGKKTEKQKRFVTKTEIKENIFKVIYLAESQLQ